MLKRIISSFISVIMVLAVCAPAAVQGEGLETYQASAAYDTTQNPAGPWQWNKYDIAAQAYSALTDTRTDITISGANQGEVFAYTATNSANALTVAPGWMRVDQSDAEKTFDDYYAVRTFTAPKAGGITITADDGTGESNLLGLDDSATTVGPNVRIMLDKTDGARVQVWPAKEWQSVLCRSIVPFAPLSIGINEGDKLHFELSNTHATGPTAIWRGSAYWDPVITYDSYTLATKSFVPEVLDGVPENQMFSITFKEEIAEITQGDISISGGAWVNSFSYTNNRTLRFDFGGLSEGQQYDVTISDLAERSNPGEKYIYAFSFNIFSMPTYQASVDYSTTQNPTGPWQWDRCVPDTTSYTRLTAIKSDLSLIAGASIGTAYYYSATASVNGLAVGTGWMRVDQSDAEKTFDDYYAVRTFTAPETGNITITADDATGGSNILGMNDAATSIGPKVRIMLDKADGARSQIWPESGWQSVLCRSVVPFEALNININVGDKLRFELSNTHATGSTAIWRGSAYWDPVITYNSFSLAVEEFVPENLTGIYPSQEFSITFQEEIEEITPEDIYIDNASAVKKFSFTNNKTISFSFEGLKGGEQYNVTISNLTPLSDSGVRFSYSFSFTTFLMPAHQASEDYITTQNPVGPWQWDRCVPGTTDYIALTATHANLNAIAGASIGTAYYYSAGGSPNGLAVGRGWMRVDQSDAANTFDDYYAVRTFTAPETGSITIAADDGTGKSNILGMNDAATTVGPNVRIMLDKTDGTREQVWPESDWQSVLCGSTVPFTPLNLDVSQGDKLRFELSNTHATGGTAIWRGSAYWDPTVVYTAIYPAVSMVYPAKGSTDVPINTVFNVEYAQEIYPVEITDIIIDNGAVVKNAWIENGNELYFEFDQMQANTQYTIGIKNVRFPYMPEDHNFIYYITYTTAPYIVYGTPVVDGGALKTGSNKIILDINNTLGDAQPHTATMVVALCAGTPEDYRIERVKYKTRNDIGQNDSIELLIDVTDLAGCFLKTVLIDSLAPGEALTPIYIMGVGGQ